MAKKDKEHKIPNNQRMTLLCDNSIAIEIVKNPIHRDRTKHMEIDRHFIKEKLEYLSCRTFPPTTILLKF